MPVSNHQKCRFKKVKSQLCSKSLCLSFSLHITNGRAIIYSLFNLSLLYPAFAPLAHKSSSHESRSSPCPGSSLLPKQQSHVQPHSKPHIVSNTDSKSSNAILRSRMLQAYAVDSVYTLVVKTK